MKLSVIYKKKSFYERVFVFIILFSFAFFVLDIIINGYLSFQWNLFFDNKLNDFLGDLLNLIGYSRNKDVYNDTTVYGLGEKAYPPLSYVIFRAFSRLLDIEGYYTTYGNYLMLYLDHELLLVLIGFITISVVFVFELVKVYKNGSYIIKLLFALSIIFSYPMLFSIERGNTIIYAVAFLMFYIINYNSENKYIRELAYISLAVSAAFKMAPALFGILLLYEKRWKDVIRTVIYGVILFFGPFLFLENGFKNIGYMIRNLSVHIDFYSNAKGCNLLGGLLYYCVSFPNMGIVMKIITYVLCILFVVCSFFAESEFERIILIVLVVVILPAHSATYCLLYFVPGIIAFFNEDKKGIKDLLFLLAILCIMIPYQSVIGQLVFNFHVGIFLMVGYCCFISYKILSDKCKLLSVQKEEKESK